MLVSVAYCRADPMHRGMVFALLIMVPCMGNDVHCRNGDGGEKDEGVLQLVEENLLPFKGLIKMPVMLDIFAVYLAPPIAAGVKVMRAVSESAIPGAELCASTTRIRSRSPIVRVTRWIELRPAGARCPRHHGQGFGRDPAIEQGFDAGVIHISGVGIAQITDIFLPRLPPVPATTK